MFLHHNVVSTLTLTQEKKISTDNELFLDLFSIFFSTHLFNIWFGSVHYLSNILNIIRSIITHFLQEKENRRKIIIKNNTITSKMKIRAENL